MKTLSEFLDNIEVEHMFEAVSKLKFAKLPNWNKFYKWDESYPEWHVDHEKFKEYVCNEECPEFCLIKKPKQYPELVNFAIETILVTAPRNAISYENDDWGYYAKWYDSCFEEKKQAKKHFTESEVEELYKFVMEHVKDKENDYYTFFFELIHDYSKGNQETSIFDKVEQILNDRFGGYEKWDSGGNYGHYFDVDLDNKKCDNQWKLIFYPVFWYFLSKCKDKNVFAGYNKDEISCHWMGRFINDFHKYTKSIEDEKSKNESYPECIKKIRFDKEEESDYDEALKYFNKIAKDKYGKPDLFLFAMNNLRSNNSDNLLKTYKILDEINFKYYCSDTDKIESVNKKLNELGIWSEYESEKFKTYFHDLVGIDKYDVHDVKWLQSVAKTVFSHIWRKSSLTNGRRYCRFEIDDIFNRNLWTNINFPQSEKYRNAWKKDYNSDQMQCINMILKYYENESIHPGQMIEHTKLEDFDDFWDKVFYKLDVSKIEKEDKKFNTCCPLKPIYDLCDAMHKGDDENMSKHVKAVVDNNDDNYYDKDEGIDGEFNYFGEVAEIDPDVMPDDWLLHDNKEAPYWSLSRYAWIIIVDLAFYLALSQYLDPEQKSRYAWGNKLAATFYSDKGFQTHRIVNTIEKQAQKNIKAKNKKK